MTGCVLGEEEGREAGDDCGYDNVPYEGTLYKGLDKKVNGPEWLQAIKIQPYGFLLIYWNLLRIVLIA